MTSTFSAATPVITVSSTSCSAFRHHVPCKVFDSVLFTDSSDEEEISEISDSIERNEDVNADFIPLDIPTGMFLPNELISRDGFKAVIRPARPAERFSAVLAKSC